MKKPRLQDFFENKEVDKGKEVKLEKNDFLALCIAAATVFIPMLLLFIAALALFIWGFVSWAN